MPAVDFYYILFIVKNRELDILRLLPMDIMNRDVMGKRDHPDALVITRQVLSG